MGVIIFMCSFQNELIMILSVFNADNIIPFIHKLFYFKMEMKHSFLSFLVALPYFFVTCHILGGKGTENDHSAVLNSFNYFNSWGIRVYKSLN